jgi:hypothetical protein
MIKHRIGKNRLGVLEYLSAEELEEVYRFPRRFEGKFTNQQWAKIRKLIKKEFINGIF